MRRSVILATVLFFITLTGCSGDEGVDKVSAEEPETESPWPPVQIKVMGVARKPLQAGFRYLAANCEEWQEAPTLGPVNIQIPADWEVRKGYSGPRKGKAVLYPEPRRYISLTVHLVDQMCGTAPRPVLGANAQEVGAIDWYGERIGIYFHPDVGASYSAYIPVLSVVDYADVYARLVLGGSRNLEIEKLDRAKVIRMFQSVSLDECGVQSYAELYEDRQVTYLDEL